MTTLETSKLRPGRLVSCKTSIVGNMKYTSTPEKDERRDDGSQFRQWETTCTVYDPKEQERAVKVRSEATGLITSICAYTAFGLLCPEDKMPQLTEAVEKARKLCTEFNDTATYSRVRFNLITAIIASDDVEAFQSIGLEMREQMRKMEEGIASADIAGVKKIRDAAYATLQMSKMLQDSDKEEAQAIVTLARAAASKIVKAGESAAQEIDRETIKAIAARRTKFLDLSGVAEVAAPVGKKRAVGLDPTTAAPEAPAAEAKTQQPSKNKATRKIATQETVVATNAVSKAPRKRSSKRAVTLQ